MANVGHSYFPYYIITREDDEDDITYTDFCDVYNEHFAGLAVAHYHILKFEKEDGVKRPKEIDFKQEQLKCETSKLSYITSDH